MQHNELQTERWMGHYDDCLTSQVQRQIDHLLDDLILPRSQFMQEWHEKKDMELVANKFNVSVKRCMVRAKFLGLL